MSEDTGHHSKKGLLYKAIVIPLTLSGVTFLGNYVWSLVTSISALQAKVEKLEDDRSKWGTLNELHNKQLELELRLRLAENNIEWVRWSVQNAKVVEPKGEPEIRPPLPIPELPKYDPPKLDPQQLDPDAFRKMQQEKYPHQYKK